MIFRDPIKECYCMKKHKWLDVNSYTYCFDCVTCITSQNMVRGMTYKKLGKLDQTQLRLKKLNKL